MKKRIFTALLAVLMLAFTMLPCFAAEDTISFDAKNAVYDPDAKAITFTLANTSKTEAYINTIGFTVDTEVCRVDRLYS